MIPFNKPYLTGKETHYMYDALSTGKLSGNGKYTKKCQQYFEESLGLKKALLTTSCTDALEMCALLLDIKPGDEVIVPSYTFVSSALAFVREGARIVFADSREDNPNMDEDKIEKLIAPQTKAIVVVHYAGIAVDMDPIMELASKHDIFVVEDAAQAVDSFYKEKPLGSIGHLSAFSFHETKNIIAGEGGLLGINDERFLERAEILWEKGTNRASFFRGEVNKYGWVDTGSSFLPSEITAAFLYAQIEELEKIQTKRKTIWEKYNNAFRSDLDLNYGVILPSIPKYATNNGHMYYLVCKNAEQRSNLISKLKEKDILAVFHYLSLHKSDYYGDKYNGKDLPKADFYSNCLIRLPFYFELDNLEQEKIIKLVKDHFNNQHS